MSYMISAWARICKILGEDFEQYLPLVINPVIRTALYKPDVALVDSTEIQSMEKDADWQFVTLGDQVCFS